MTSPHSSPSTSPRPLLGTSPRALPGVVAVEAVVGQFLGRRTLVSGLVLTVVSAWAGNQLGPRGEGRLVTTGVLLATAGTVSSIAWTWVLSTRWTTMALLPVRSRDLARAVYLVGTLVMLIEVTAPAAAFMLTGLGASYTTVVVTACLGLGAAPLVILLWSATSSWHRVGAGATLVAVMVVVVRAGPAYGAATALVAAGLCLVTGPEVGTDRPRQPRAGRLARSSLVLGELLRSAMTQVNSLVLLGTGTLLNLALQRHGSPWLPGCLLVVINTPLSSYFSRHPSTWLTVRVCPRTWLSYWRFGAQLAVFYAACATAVTLAPGWSPRTPANLAAALVAAVAAAGTAAAMEMYWPFTDWKSQREVLRHPRKYLPAVAALAAAGCGWLLSAI
ncbi:hypothetical protein D5R93_08100 [Actinomyces lilanjuaniae]|uniref:Integral membrane protein n=1 Tax=Actinomyces lilanjuaniae TaxID=2321394 RepID=A0ABM6Z3T7_9ACTO|nr:hypothetical protein [Actinomyces lilanjuaniae]AYD89995.1 hypothetical protein D5R93_08100 [Actinomyces lilanjuaniae]